MAKSSSEVGDFRIRPMRPEEIRIAVAWAADEGWNPGQGDDICFGQVDPEGFFAGEVAGEIAAMISNVNYDRRFSFLGFYIVKKEFRGRGLGLSIWRQALEHSGDRTVGLDGVVAQQDNYRKSGFVLAYQNARFGGSVAIPLAMPRGIRALQDVDFDALVDDDASVFPARRAQFLKCWINGKGRIALALRRAGRLSAWGIIRPSKFGHRIGPLIADDAETAQAICTALIHAANANEIFIDVPELNRSATALAQSMGLVKVFETARMYRGAAPGLNLERLFGVTSFELG